MIGIIVAGHIHFSSGLRSAVEAIAGEQKQVRYIDFVPKMSTEQLEKEMRVALSACQQGDGVIIFTDIAGGSPCNRATALLADYSDIRIISGSNLPMIVNACMERDGLTLDELTSLLVETGRESISQISLVMGYTSTVVNSDIEDDL